MRFVFLISTLVYCFLNARLAAAGETAPTVRTDYWGIVWTNDQEFATTVTNAPGRIKAPVYYAFLDGCDTRNAFFTNGLSYEIGVEHTNLTARFSEFANVRDRFNRLANLDFAATSQLESGSYANEQTFWSSTAFDGMTNAWPAVGGFSLTKVPYDLVFETATSNNVGGTWVLSPFNTLWLPTFAATSGNSYGNATRSGAGEKMPTFYPRKYAGEYAQPHGYYGVAAKALNNIDFGYLSYTNKLAASMGNFEGEWMAFAPSTPSFDDAFMRTYGVTNFLPMTNISARHTFKQQQQGERACALFDRVIHLADAPVIYTNKSQVVGHVNFSGDATLGNVALTFGSTGITPSIQGGNPYMSRKSGGAWGVDTNATHVTISSDYNASSAPRYRLYSPSTSSSATFWTVGAEEEFWVAVTNREVQACLNSMLNEAGTDDELCQVDSFREDSYNGNVCLRIVHRTAGEYDPVTVRAEYTNGTYATSGSLGVSYLYTVDKTDGPMLPYGVTPWPPSERFKAAANPYTFYTFYSYIVATNTVYAWYNDVWYNNYEPQEDFGFACWINSSTRRAGAAEGLTHAALDIEEQEDEFSMCVTNPLAYSQMTVQCLNKVRDNYNSDRAGKVHLSASIELMDNLDVEVCRFDGVVHVYMSDSGKELKGFQVAKRSEIAITIDTSINGVKRRTTPCAIDGHIQQVIDARLEFPQCTSSTNTVINR